ncbi:helix-turn-helix domain-containing protein [Streptomyces sp. NPDC052701]|uniref:AraC family transcriptional regulator n=1 Tax=Streptomyces sp. NPDC052701 TaxID=3155533 RepID=UPI00342E0548
MTSAVLAEHPLPVPDTLRPWIAGIAATSADVVAPAPFTHLPDPAAKLVVRVEGSGRREAMVVGPRTRASYHAGERPVSCVQLRLAPGTARPLLGVPAVDLVGRVVPLGALPAPAARRLAAALPEPAAGRMADHLADILSAAVEADRSRAGLLRAAVAALSAGPDGAPVRVREAARRLAVSERQLRNLFAEGVGLSPKHYARIDRVRHVLTRAGSVPWAELAAAVGYYDQSHMTSDFRALMGVPPRAFFTGRLPRARPCQEFARR